MSREQIIERIINAPDVVYDAIPRINTDTQKIGYRRFAIPTGAVGEALRAAAIQAQS